MAVIDAVPGLEISVCINGQPVNEYEDSGEEIDGPLASKTVVKYIEATSDTEFTIKGTVRPAFDEHRQTRDDLFVSAMIDGKWVDGVCRDCTKNSEHIPWNVVLDGVRGNAAGRGTIKAFTFTTVEIVEIADKAKIDEHVKAAANLGEITVEVFRVKLLGYTHYPVGTVVPILHLRYLRKLSKAALSHMAPQALRMLLIIPRSPSPDPFEALPAVERERLAREAFLRQQDPKPEPGIKPERIVKRERRDSDVVDLTGDAPTAKQRKTTMEAPIDLTDD
ncbi:hypothetical protein V492_06572 [Pseudogymnoascus sp. VKM F-4246]|nr:hypothetical protein V492_06572 [Pseudogymnoascus sp. VKM F-4246]